ncbi:aminotransferase class IV [Acetobacter sp. TBRC 12305]|uniref:Probable branched-chain-amino-acid aminotransferase n=1 Tax=Acetobacter garciniae TaxID=2817435 RepID=A0A939KNP3_9PROT|nr:aminotransferase class IV [Acetobacter garciniae]MBO1326603.1 aminotransferase class IV [Acetobacter garciniae]MBX0346303.1 aminotransferase class IV [Acetobacter garciniae]
MSIIWHNGVLCPLEQARISPMDRGYTLGDGLFETMRVRAGCVMNLYAHMRRLAEGGRVLNLAVPDTATVRQAAADLAEATGLVEGSMRLTVTRGESPRGLLPPQSGTPTMTLVASAGGFATAQVRVMTSRLIRRDETSPLSRIKSLNYLPSILARQEAERAGADDALILNLAGRVAESTVGTLVIAGDDGLLTPPVAEGALPGVARGVLMAKGLLREHPLDTEQILWAHGAWLVNTLSLKTITRLDVQVMAQDADITRQIAECLQHGE